MGNVVVWMDMKGHFVNTVWMSARPAPVKMEGHVWMDINTTVVNVSPDSQVFIVFHGFEFKLTETISWGAYAIPSALESGPG